MYDYPDASQSKVVSPSSFASSSSQCAVFVSFSLLGLTRFLQETERLTPLSNKWTFSISVPGQIGTIPKQLLKAFLGLLVPKIFRHFCKSRAAINFLQCYKLCWINLQKQTLGRRSRCNKNKSKSCRFDLAFSTFFIYYLLFSIATC